MAALCDPSCPTQIDRAVCWHGACLPTHTIQAIPGYDLTFGGKGIRVTDAGVMFAASGNHPIRYEPATGAFVDTYPYVNTALNLLSVAPGYGNHAYGTAASNANTIFYLYDFAPDAGQATMVETSNSTPLIDVAEGGYVCRWCIGELGNSWPAADQFFIFDGNEYWFDLASNGSFVRKLPLDGGAETTTSNFQSYPLKGMAANDTSVFVLIPNMAAGPAFSSLAVTSADLTAAPRVYDLPPLSFQGIAADGEYVYFGVPQQAAKDNRGIVAAMRLMDGRLERLAFLRPATSSGYSPPSLVQISLTSHYLYILATDGTWWARLPN
jgi:hypothetical protein